MERFLLVQSIWDSVMAEQAVRVRRRTGGPVVVLAGGWHVENGYGIAHRLRIFDPDARIMTVMPYSSPAPGGGADIFFYSPARKRFGLRFEDGPGAPVVATVFPGSPAETAGLRSGDKVVSAAGAPGRTAMDLHQAAVRALSDGKALSLTIERGRERREIELR